MSAPEQGENIMKSDLRLLDLTNILERDERKPTKSKPTKSKPTKSKPTKSKPTKSKPTKSKPTKSKPTKSKPTKSKPTLKLVILERSETMKSSNSPVNINVDRGVVNIQQGNNNEIKDISIGMTTEITEQLEQFMNKINELTELTKDQKDLLCMVVKKFSDHSNGSQEEQVESKKMLQAVVKSFGKLAVSALEALATSMGAGFGAYWVNLITG